MVASAKTGKYMGDPFSSVKLRFFVGMTAGESAELLGLSERTVKQYWSYAKTWLYREIQSKREGT